MILVDTSVWIDFLRGHNHSHVRLLNEWMDRDRLATGDLILVELLRGCKTGKGKTRILDMVRYLEYYDLVGRQVAEQAADYYLVLQKKGRTIRKTVDLLIGTFCLMKGFKLLHNDRDFKVMEDLLGLTALR